MGNEVCGPQVCGAKKENIVNPKTKLSEQSPRKTGHSSRNYRVSFAIPSRRCTDSGGGVDSNVSPSSTARPPGEGTCIPATTPVTAPSKVKRLVILPSPRSQKILTGSPRSGYDPSWHPDSKHIEPPPIQPPKATPSLPSQPTRQNVLVPTIVYPYPSSQAEEKGTPDCTEHGALQSLNSAPVGGSKGALQQSLKIKPSAFPALDDVREGGGFYDDVLDSARGIDDGIQFPTLLTGTEIATEARAAAALAAAAFEDSLVSSARNYETKLPDLLCTKSDKVLLLFSFTALWLCVCNMFMCLCYSLLQTT